MIINENDIGNITDNHYLNEIYKESIFIDIETTGLSKIYSDIISITLLLYENDKFKIFQIFCLKMDLKFCALKRVRLRV